MRRICLMLFGFLMLFIPLVRGGNLDTSLMMTSGKDTSNPLFTSTIVLNPSQEQENGTATVIADQLNLRSTPGLNSQVIRSLPRGTVLTVLGYSADSQWVQVQIQQGAGGWVAVQWVEIAGDSTVTDLVAGDLPIAPPINFDGVISNITGRTHEIFMLGQRLGNRPEVFSKIGDSITASSTFPGSTCQERPTT